MQEYEFCQLAKKPFLKITILDLQLDKDEGSDEDVKFKDLGEIGNSDEKMEEDVKEPEFQVKVVDKAGKGKLTILAMKDDPTLLMPHEGYKNPLHPVTSPFYK